MTNHGEGQTTVFAIRRPGHSAILVRLRKGDLNIKKPPRYRLRNEYGFYFSDFDDSRQAFTQSYFDTLMSGSAI